MSDSEHWSFPAELQPRANDVRFDLRRALDAVVSLRASVPDDAFTASILGTERTGSAIVIREDGLMLTIGYLVTEAESIWITTNGGTTVPAHPLAVDFATGFGLVLPLGELRAPALPRAAADPLDVDDDVFVFGHGGRAHALAARVIARREFAGYWEYVLDEALFTAPPHPEWSGAALVDDAGRLRGVGSLLVQEAVGDTTVQGNMFVPVDLLDPILDGLLKTGRTPLPPRPWLGMYTTEVSDHLVVNGIARSGPADGAGIRLGDIVVEVGDERVGSLAEMYRKVWRRGPPGTVVPLTVVRSGTILRIDLRSADRADFLRKPRLQ